MSYAVFLGSNCFDEYYLLHDELNLGDKVSVSFKSREVGGMIGNAASVFASYGGQAYMLDFLDKSDGSSKLIEQLESFHISTEGISQSNQYTNGKCIILLSNSGERLILVAESNNPKYELSEKQFALLKECDYLYTTVSDLKKLFHYEKILSDIQHEPFNLVLDVEGASINDKEDLSIINLSNILFINEFSMKKMRNLFGKDILAELRKSGKIIVVTMGSKGSISYTKRTRLSINQSQLMWSTQRVLVTHSMPHFSMVYRSNGILK